MRIDIGTLLAVLFLAAWLPPLTSPSPSNRSLSNRQLNRHRSTRRAATKPTHHYQSRGVEFVVEEEEFEEELEERGGGTTKIQHHPFGSRMGIKQMQQMLMREGRGIECCPSRLEMTTPDGAISRDGDYITLFRNDEIRQTFYEQTCLPGVEDKPCYFLDRRMHNQSRCVQKRSFTYAMVLNPLYSKELNEGGGGRKSIFSQEPSIFNSTNSKWMMDYIQINSGCACEVQPKHRRKKHDKSKKSKSKKIDFD